MSDYISELLNNYKYYITFICYVDFYTMRNAYNFPTKNITSVISLEPEFNGEENKWRQRESMLPWTSLGYFVLRFSFYCPLIPICNQFIVLWLRLKWCHIMYLSKRHFKNNGNYQYRSLLLMYFRKCYHCSWAPYHEDGPLEIKFSLLSVF